MATTALAVLSCAFGLALVSLPTLRAEDSGTMKAPAAHSKKLPLSVSFDKKPADDGREYTLSLKNESKDALKVTTDVRHSVVAHNRPSSDHMADRAVAAGETLTIPELASMDKVTVTAEGYAPLEVVVP